MKDKITIGLFNDSFFPMADGVIMVVDNYAKKLSKYANVIVFAPNYIGKNYDDNQFSYKVVRCHSLKVPFLDYSLPIPKLDLKFRKILDEYNLDIVHIHSPFTVGMAGLDYAIKRNIPCIGTMHSQFKQDFQKAVKIPMLAEKMNDGLIRTFNKCTECWAVNKEIARIYHEDYGYKTVPRVMNNATEMLPVENLDEARRYINELYGINDNEKVFLFVGRINTLKNILFIADSIKIIKEKNPDWKFKMLYVGSGQDEEKLSSHIKELRIDDVTIMCGKVSDREKLAYYFARADLFLFPSVYDASSIVQIEAASQSTPCVFLEGTATASTVTNNVNGILTKHNAEDYANRIIEVMNDKKFYNTLSKNAHRDLYKNWDTVVDEAYELYLKFINKEL